MEYCYRFEEHLDVDDEFATIFENLEADYGGRRIVERQAYYYYDEDDAIYMIFYRIPRPQGRILFAYGDGVLHGEIQSMFASIEGAIECSGEIKSQLAI